MYKNSSLFEEFSLSWGVNGKNIFIDSFYFFTILENEFFYSKSPLYKILSTRKIPKNKKLEKRAKFIQIVNLKENFDFLRKSQILSFTSKRFS